MVGQMGRVTSKGKEAKLKMKISYADAKIRTQVVVICGPAPYQLDHKGDKDNNYVFANSYTEDQGRTTIKLPKTGYNSSSKVWKQLIW